MRFLIMTQYYPPEVGAAQVRLAALARELRRAGHVVEVVTALPNYPSGRMDARDRGKAWRRDVIDGVPTTRLWLYTATGTGMRRLVSYLSFSATALAGAMAAKTCDVVIVESPPLFLGVTGWLVAKRFGAALVLNVSDLWPDSVRDMGFFRHGPWLHMAERLETWLYDHSDAITAVTDGIRQRLISGKGVPPDRILFLPNGSDTDLYRPVGNSSAPLRPVLMYIGTLGYAHGLDVVLAAASQAPDIDFVLIGDGSEKARLVDKARERSLGNVRFEDPVTPETVATRYSMATAGLSTLRRSDFMTGVVPAKVLAMMACGRPVLYCGDGEGADLIRRAGAGLVVPPEDPRALVAAARKLAGDANAAAAMGARGRRYVEDNMRWQVLVTSWLGQLQDELASSRQT